MLCRHRCGTNPVSVAQYPMVPYGVAVVVLPIVTYFAQPSRCFWYLYGPIAVPVLCTLALVCAGVQHLSTMNASARLACAIVFAVGLQFILIVPCIEVTEAPVAPHRALWSLLFGVAAAVAMLIVAASMFFPEARNQALPLAIVGVGQSLSAVSIVLGVASVYLGLLSGGPAGHAEWLFVVISELNPGAALLLGLALTGFGLAASLLRRRSQA